MTPDEACAAIDDNLCPIDATSLTVWPDGDVGGYFECANKHTWPINNLTIEWDTNAVVTDLDPQAIAERLDDYLDP